MNNCKLKLSWGFQALAFFLISSTFSFGQSISTDTVSIDRLYNLSKKFWNKQDDSARYYLDQVKTLSEKTGYKRGQAYALYGYGVVEPVLYKQFQNFTQSLSIFESIGDKFGIGLNLIKIGIIYKEIGQEEKALDYFKASLAVKQEINDYGGVALTLIQIGQYYQRQGNLPEALHHFEQSLTYRLKEGSKQGIAYSQVNMSEVLYQQGKIEGALTISDSAYHNFLRTRDIRGQLWAMLVKGKSLLSLHRPAEAEEVFRSMGNYPEPFQYLPVTIDAKKELVELYKNRGDIQHAFQLQSEYLVAKDSLSRLDYRTETQRLVNEHEFRQRQAAEQEEEKFKNTVRILVAGISLFVFVLVGSILYQNNRKKQKANEILSQTLTNLKATQSQLIQSEKMASLGELTAGIAHEIQNPLNFVKNFSEVNAELLAELEQEANKGNLEAVKGLARDIRDNEEKIVSHGKRADGIVKGMLQHSRASSGKKELTDINALCDEYLRLAYHGLRAKDKSFNANFQTHLDPTLPKINVVPQEIGRVVLNLINNAFYAVTEKMKLQAESYQPLVTVTTKNMVDRVEIRVSDNGSGIPDSIKGKIFQPFFTTKPTGQGTGLGLSLSYDIVTKGHGGNLDLITRDGEGAAFAISLPMPAESTSSS